MPQQIRMEPCQTRMDWMLTVLINLKNQGESVTSYPNGQKGDTEAVISVPCDIWIPAARPDVIHEKNVNLLQTKLILQGANIPITLAAEKILFKKGIHVIPDFIANAGGVICAAVEYQGGTEAVAKEVIQQKIRDNTARSSQQFTSGTDHTPGCSQ